MMSVQYSARGSVDRPLEERTYVFCRLQDECYG